MVELYFVVFFCHSDPAGGRPNCVEARYADQPGEFYSLQDCRRNVPGWLKEKLTVDDKAEFLMKYDMALSDCLTYTELVRLVPAALEGAEKPKDQL